MMTAVFRWVVMITASSEHRTRIRAGRVVDLEREATQQRVKEAQKGNVVRGKEEAEHRQGLGRGGAHLV